MLKLVKGKQFLFIIFMLTISAGYGQQNFFTDVSPLSLKKEGERDTSLLTRFRAVTLDTAAFLHFLDTIPGEGGTAKNHRTVLEIPMPAGDMADFFIWESSTMAPELAAQFPGIKTYTGQGITDRTATIKIDWNERGFHAMILSPVTGQVFIDPYDGSTTNYMSYFKDDMQKSNSSTIDINRQTGKKRKRGCRK